MNKIISALSKYTKLNNFVRQHNMRYLDRVVSTMNGSERTTREYFKNKLFEADVYFDKDNMRLFKNFKNDDLQTLMKDVDSFIDNEIKI